MNVMLDNSEVLVDLFERLNCGENPEIVKDETREYLSKVDPANLNIAEQKLNSIGFNTTDIMKMCSALNEIIVEEMDGKILFNNLLSKLDPQHAIHILVREHDKILDFLDVLDTLNREIQKTNGFVVNNKKLETIALIADLLLESESHYRREEEILFPEIEKRGVYGPPNVMKMEHKLLRIRCRNLKHLIYHIDEIPFVDFKDRLDDIIRFIVPMMRDHIFKENNVLYPTALRIVKDDTVWHRLLDQNSEVEIVCKEQSS